MKRAAPPSTETVQLTLTEPLFKELLRDLLFREAGQPYFKRLAIPRQYRCLGAWRTLSTYQAERQLLPVGGRDTTRLIQEFFTTHATLRAEFQRGGMPMSAIRVLRSYGLPRNTMLERVHSLECSRGLVEGYHVALAGGPEPPERAEA